MKSAINTVKEKNVYAIAQLLKNKGAVEGINRNQTLGYCLSYGFTPLNIAFLAKRLCKIGSNGSKSISSDEPLERFLTLINQEQADPNADWKIIWQVVLNDRDCYDEQNKPILQKTPISFILSELCKDKQIIPSADVYLADIFITDSKVEMLEVDTAAYVDYVIRCASQISSAIEVLKNSELYYIRLRTDYLSNYLSNFTDDFKEVVTHISQAKRFLDYEYKTQLNLLLTNLVVSIGMGLIADKKVIA